MTVGSPRTHRAAHIEDRRRLPSPRVLGKPKKRGHASRFEPGTRQSLRRPSAASACPPLKLPAWERRAPATAIDIAMPFDPRNSPETVLRKHEECDKESARRQVQGALEQAGRRGALVSECAGAGERWPGAPVEERPSAGHCTCSWASMMKLSSPMDSGLRPFAPSQTPSHRHDGFLRPQTLSSRYLRFTILLSLSLPKLLFAHREMPS